MTLQTLVRELELAQKAKGATPDLPANIRELTGFKPRPLQQRLEDEARRFNVNVLHRRFGKTVFWLEMLIEAAVNCVFPAGRYAYLAPTYGMAEDIAWAYIQNMTEKIPGRELQKSRLAVWLPTYYGTWARIRLYGVDSPKQRLRGMYLDGVVLDEFPEMPPSVWTEQVRPMLSDAERMGWDQRGWRNQWATFVGTPKGRNRFYTFFRNADVWARGDGIEMPNKDTGRKELVYRDDWYAARHSAEQTGVLTRSELRAARMDMSEAEYDQEYGCSFDAAVEGAIFAPTLEDMRKRGQIRQMPYNPALPVHTGWDLGHDDDTAIWFCQLQGLTPVLIDYYEGRQIMDLGHYADVLVEKGYRYGRHFFPHDVEHKFLGMLKTRVQILNELGIRVTRVPKHSPHDRNPVTRRWLAGAYINESRCLEGLDHLSLYRRKKNEGLNQMTGIIVEDEHTHAPDALGCLVMGMRIASVQNIEDEDPHRRVVAEM